MTETIDRERALTMLRDAVNEKGSDYVVPEGIEGRNTYYAEDGVTPSCIVGHVLGKLGKTAADLYLTGEGHEEQQARVERIGAASPQGPNGRGLASVLVDGVVLTSGALSVLVTAQTAQDANLPWGDALDEAEEDAALRAKRGVR